MNGSSGYVAIYRKLQHSFLWSRSDWLAAWLDLLLTANWKDGQVTVNGQVVEVPRGSLVASERFLQERWSQWSFNSRKAVRYLLSLMDREGMILRQELGPRVTLITICNYEAYQDLAAESGPRKAHERPTKGPKKKKGRREEELQHPLVGLVADGAAGRNGTATATPAPTSPPPVDAVWSAYLTARAEHYRRKRGHLSGAEPRLTKSRRAVIETRLEDYSAEDLADATRGIFLSPYHRGENDSGTEYLSLELALSVNRDRNNVEKFRDLYHRKAVKHESRPIPAGAYSPDGRRRMGESGQWEPVEDHP